MTRKSRKKQREMTLTEYRGYKKHHRHVEHPIEREESMAACSRNDAADCGKKAKQRMKTALRQGYFDEVDKLAEDQSRAVALLHGVRYRLERKRLLEKYEDV